MRKFMRFAALMLVAGVSIPALAQDSKMFTVGVDLNSSLDSTKNVTNNSTSYGLNFGYNGKLLGTTVPFRGTLGLNMFPGSEKEGVKTSLTSYYLAGDLFIATPVDKLFLVSGISLNKYKEKVEAFGLSASESVKGYKLGARIGVEYAFTSNVSGTVMLQATELDYSEARGESRNLSWMTFGVRYHF